MDYKSPLPDRQCLLCSKPLTGRADKKFCNSSCKSSYSRCATPGYLIKTETFSATQINTPQYGSFPAEAKFVINPKYLTSENQGYSLRYAQLKCHQAENDPYFDSYATIIEKFLYEGYYCADSLNVLDLFIKDVFEVTLNYSANPKALNSEGIASTRLFDLKVVYSYLTTFRTEAFGFMTEIKNELGEEAIFKNIHLEVFEPNALSLWKSLLGLKVSNSINTA